MLMTSSIFHPTLIFAADTESTQIEAEEALADSEAARAEATD